MNSFDCFVLKLILLVTLISLTIDAASRQPNSRDHLHCRMEFHDQWEEVMQTADPYAIVEAYHNSHGTPCQTNCRLRSPSNPALTTVLGEKNSPNYENCGAQKFCYEGRCISKRFQTF
ncbi:chitin binding peritrophin-A [Sarcoptes scabiei]|nr:chitin binding peritrophin-A [Sarcoptes scabiei]